MNRPPAWLPGIDPVERGVVSERDYRQRKRRFDPRQLDLSPISR